MQKTIGIAAVAAVALVAGYIWWGSAEDEAAAPVAEGAAMVAVTLPETLSEQAQLGQRAFEAKCSACHGDNAAGREGNGPPLIHKIYEPSHHGDGAFMVAASNGVRQHHWSFGNMPPVEGITPAEVKAIVTYVREVQRANGID
ncbi:c-type cytochrome [Sulfitobacter delicatus]|uniref:Cytochrome c n=1 Tax=Sulfitobacter delicatus TaxID=218672 RepID=A0A1G7WBD0_9RHOB|nr:cytochrome c [Sulfitobacter delicatus]SDG69231.1 Cytochrome c [Sulfitobacter delicatus]